MPDVRVHMFNWGIRTGNWNGPIPGRGSLHIRGLGSGSGSVNAAGYGGIANFGKFQFLEIYGQELATLGGTVVPTVEENAIVAGGQTLLITLENRAWVPVGLGFNAQRQAILDGITSTQSESNGWNAQAIHETAVVRTSDNLVTVTLPPLPDYRITQNETVTVKVPATAIEESSMPVNAGTFQIINQTPVSATLSGTVVPSVEESAVVAGGGTLIITLANGTWAASGAGFDAQRQPILDGIVSAQAEAAGWNAQKTNVPVTAVARTSDTVVTITLPALSAYEITADETLTVTVPDAAFVQNP